jgi:hypothetical protein
VGRQCTCFRMTARSAREARSQNFWFCLQRHLPGMGWKVAAGYASIYATKK